MSLLFLFSRRTFCTLKSVAYDYNVRLYNLGRLGRVHDARKLFDEMPHRDIVSYTSMITIYIKNNDIPSAENLFQAIPVTNIVADSAMIDAYAKAGRMDDARRIFDQMPCRNVYSWTSLISGWFRNGYVHEAQKLFEQMPDKDKNVVSWTAVVLGYARNGLIDQARATFDQMDDKNVVAWTAMVKAYVENGRTDDALKVFNDMPNKNVYSWNVMIKGCFDDGRVNEGVKLFVYMPRRNNVTWTTMVTGLGKGVSAKLARHYFNQMPGKDVAAWNAMVTTYADEGKMDAANELFGLMPERDLVSWNTLIGGYARRGGNEALKHLVLLLRCCSVRLRPNECTLTSVLTSCEEEGLLQTHALAMRLGVVCDVSFTNALITVYPKCGDVASARLVFDSCEEKDTVSWTTMIVGYATHGFGARAIENLARMLRVGYKPDEVTFVGVLTACSHTGLVSKGWRFFNSMTRAYDLEPRAEHYACLVDMLGRAGQVDKALDVVLQMPRVKRDAVVLGALLGACKLHGNDVLANEIAEELIRLEPSQSGGYVVLANVFAASGKWERVAQVRRQMKGKVISKVPGFSQVYVKGRHHVFCIGDASHTDFNEINEMLRDKLLPQMLPQLYGEQDHLF